MIEETELINSYYRLNSNLTSFSDKQSAHEAIKKICFSDNSILIVDEIARSSAFYALDNYLLYTYSELDTINLSQNQLIQFLELLWIHEHFDEFQSLIDRYPFVLESKNIMFIHNYFDTNPDRSFEIQEIGKSITPDILILCKIRKNFTSRIFDEEIEKTYLNLSTKYLMTDRTVLEYLDFHSRDKAIAQKFEAFPFLIQAPPLAIYYLRRTFSSQSTDKFWNSYHSLAADLLKIQGTSLEQSLNNELSIIATTFEERRREILNDVQLHSEHLFSIFSNSGGIKSRGLIPACIVGHQFLVEIFLISGLKYLSEVDSSQIHINEIVDFLKGKKDIRSAMFFETSEQNNLEKWFGYEIGECRFENSLPVGVSIYEVFDASPIEQLYATILLEQIQMWGGRRTLDSFINSVFSNDLKNLNIISITRGVIDSFDSEMLFVNHPSITRSKSIKLEHLQASPAFYNSLLNLTFNQLKVLHLNHVSSLKDVNDEYQIEYLIQKNKSLHRLFELHLEGSINKNNLNLLSKVNFLNLQELNLSYNDFQESDIQKILNANWFPKLQVLNLSFSENEDLFLLKLCQLSPQNVSLKKLLLYSEAPISEKLIGEFLKKFAQIEFEYSKY